MPDLHRVDVGIAVSTSGQRFLVAVGDDGDVIGIPLVSLAAGCSPRDVARKMLLDITGLVDGQWVLLRPVGILEEESMLLALYGVELPEIVPVPHGFAWAVWDQIATIPRLIVHLLTACNGIRE